MGTTCTSLHLLRPANVGRDVARDLKAAYAKLGYAAAGKGGEAGTKQVIRSLKDQRRAHSLRLIQFRQQSGLPQSAVEC